MTAPQPVERSDDELLAEFRADPDGARGRDAVSQLLGRYQRHVYVWCHRVVRDPERALDLAQEVLTRAYRALPGFEARSKFSTWLFVIARNRCLNAVARVSMLRDEDADPDSLPSLEPSPAEQYEQKQDEASLHQLLQEHLEPDERQALWLRCFEHLAVEDITRIMQLKSASGARALLQRARRRLKAALERRAEEES